MFRTLTALGAALVLLACDGTDLGTPDSGAGGGGGGWGSGGGGGGSGGPLTYEQVLAQAPPDWAFAGTRFQWGDVSFNVPKNWTTTQLTDGVQVTFPGAAGSQCNIFVLEPRTVPADETGRFQALLTLMQSLFPTSVIKGQYGTDPMTWRKKGLAGGGFDYVGLTLDIDNSLTKPYLAIFGSTGVPLIPLEQASASCLSSQEGEVDFLEVFHTLKLSSFVPPSSAPLKSAVVGTWTSVSGSIGIGLILGANAQYLSLASISGTRPVSATQVQDVTATWSGDGRYVSIGNVNAYWPASSTTGPKSHWARVYQEENSTAPTGWITRICEIKRSVVGTLGPYEICLTKDP